MASQRVPRSASFAFDTATRSLDEQLHRVEALDSKAAALLAADLIVTGLILGGDRALGAVPSWIVAVSTIGILLLLVAVIRAFANQRYLVAPEPGVAAMLANAPEDWIRWRLMGNMLESIDTNTAKLQQKARWLTSSQIVLTVSIAPLGGYFVWSRLSGGT